MSYDLPDALIVEADGPVRTVVINRPDELNAVNEELHWDLANVWRQMSADQEARVVILTAHLSDPHEHRRRLLALRPDPDLKGAAGAEGNP